MLEEILVSGIVPRDSNILKVELRLKHKVKSRLFLLDYILPDSIGAELGVFTGLFSSILAKEPKITQVTFVDPWWKAFGEHYPNWGSYTDYGRIKTRNAFEVASQRIAKPGLPNRIVEVDFSYNWLESLPDKSLDWVYLDSTHLYEGTKRELELLDRKIGNSGLIMGDDWVVNRNEPHHGLFLAANEFLKSSNFEMVSCNDWGQWIMRRALPDKSTLFVGYEAELRTLGQSHPTDCARPDYDDPNALIVRAKEAMRASPGSLRAFKSVARWLVTILAMRIHRFCLDALQSRQPWQSRRAEMLLRVADRSWWLALQRTRYRGLP
jgi:hypothetical protein